MNKMVYYIFYVYVQLTYYKSPNRHLPKTSKKKSVVGEMFACYFITYGL